MVSIGFHGVTLASGGRVLITRAHLTLGPGDICLISGDRGSGKSLLLAAAAGAVDPREGTVSIAGRELGGLQASARPYVRRNIGYLPADPPLVREETGLENVMLALAVRGFGTGEAEHIARRTLDELGAGPCAERQVAALSVGDRRLVALARALAGPPPIAVIDEPTAGLGEADRGRIADSLLGARAAGGAVLVASNDGLLVATLTAQGARHMLIVGGELREDKGPVRVVGDDGGADVIPLYPRSVREVS